MPSFQKRDSGLWSVRFTCFEGDKEKQKRLSGYETKREAREAYEKYMSDHIVQKKREISPVESFEDLCVAFLAHKKTSVRESSYLAYESRIRNHILPYFRGKKTREITKNDILCWQHMLSGSCGQKKTLRGNLHSVFAFGAKYYDLENPVADVDGIKDTGMPAEMHIWTPRQFEQFLSVVNDPVDHALFHFLYASGCRLGEALALTPADISGRTVSITKSVTRATKGNPYNITPPKNRYSVRKITVPQSVIDEMPTDKAFVFGSDRPAPTTSVQYRFDRYITASDVPKIRIHDLRHSHASYLLSQHISVVAVSRRLGHKNAQITLSVYAHMMPSDNDEIDAAISSL